MAPRPDPGRSDAETLREALSAWPEVVVPEPTFLRYLAEHGLDAHGPHLADLVLACACSAGDPQALAVFERVFVATLPDVVVRAGYPPAVAAEAVQLLRTRLLVGEGGRAGRITAFEGRAPLEGWLQVVALREARGIHRHESVHASLRPDAPAPALSLEEAAVRQRYGPLFEGAFAEAFRGLPSEDRLALRLHFVDGLNLDALATTFGFSRATAGRRLLLARTRLRDETMRLVGERLGASETEVESVLNAIRSALELSFGALLTKG